MKTLPLRDFQREGVKSLGENTSTEPLLLAGRGQDFILFPLTQENRSAMLDLTEGLAAVAALRQDQVRAMAAGLDRLSKNEIDHEIQQARKSLKRRKRSA